MSPDQARPHGADRYCPACGGAVHREDRFCRSCGSALQDAGRRGTSRGPAGIRAVGLIVLALAAVAAFLVYGTRDPEPASQRIPVGAVGTGGGSAPASRSLTPREAADQLFNRAMSAVENGDSAEAATFVPMALTAYRGLSELDLDARYHVGLLQLARGQPRAALAQADTMLDRVPDHLLALGIAARANVRLGDNDRAAELYRRFLDSDDAETAAARPEYLDHGASLEAQRQEARAFLDSR